MKSERAQIEKRVRGGRGCFRGGKIQNSIMQKKEREKKKAILLSNNLYITETQEKLFNKREKEIKHWFPYAKGMIFCCLWCSLFNKDLLDF